MTTLVLLTALSVLTLNMFLPALPTMGAYFEVSEGVMGLSISAYMACAAVFQLSLGALSDRIGRRPVLLGVLGIYAATSIVCLTAQSIEVFLVARAVQAVAVACGVLSSAVVRDQYEGRAAAAKLGTIATAMAIAPMMAPVLGGYLDSWLGWRAIFATYMVIGLAAFTLVWIDVGETKRPGIIRRPKLTVLLRERVFWAYTAVLGFSVGAFFTFVTGAPFVAAEVYDLSSDQIGLALGSITMGFMVGAGVSTRMVERVGGMPIILVGRSLPLCALALALIIFWAGAGTMWVLFAATMTVGIGNGLTVANSNAGALAVRPEMAGSAAGLAGACVLVTGAGLSGIATAVLSAEASPTRLIALMLAAVTVSLIAALLARHWSRS